MSIFKRPIVLTIICIISVLLADGYVRLHRFYKETAQIDTDVFALKSGDYGRAVRILTPYAEQRNATAELNLGIAYAYGLGVRRDRMKAQALLQDSFVGMSLKRMIAGMYFSIARSYEHGDGVKADKNEALVWYEIAANAGSNEARMRLKGLMDSNDPRSHSQAG
jgi:TPR repeat protein